MGRKDLEDEGFRSTAGVQEGPGDEKCFVLKVTKEPQGRAQSIIWGGVLTYFSYFLLQSELKKSNESSQLFSKAKLYLR